jgi:hypothetical protein
MTDCRKHKREHYTPVTSVTSDSLDTLCDKAFNCGRDLPTLHPWTLWINAVMPFDTYVELSTAYEEGKKSVKSVGS